MDLSQLRTLIHVAELGSLSKAADRLHIVQPALSRQIRLLEKDLGVALFERHGRGMVITEVGREILEHATRVMSELDALRNAAAGGGSPFRGMVMVGTTPTVAQIVTVPLVKRIREAHPELSIRFSSAYTGHLLDWLQRGDLELAVTYDPLPVRSLRTIPIMMEKLLFVSAGRAGLSLDRPVSFSDLVTEELIIPSPPHGLRRIIQDCAQEAGVDIRTRIEADSFGALIDLVKGGFGSTVLPLAAIYEMVRSGDLSAAPIINPEPARKLVLAYPANRAVSLAARFVGDLFITLARDLVEREIWVGHMLAESGS